MGTRADFYVGRGATAEWLGSIAWDGNPGGIDAQVLNCASEPAFRHAVSEFLDGRDDATLPKDGWPWPWDDSNTTDYSYAFDVGQTWGTCFGHGWWPADKDEPESEEEAPKVEFPDMKSRQKVTLGKRSGVIILGG